MPGSHNGRSILLVEDSEDLREMIAHTLRADGHRVLECGDADTAMALARRDSPDLVITDINLGVKSGLDLITEIRRELPPAPPIIACSAMETYAKEALRRGAMTFLRKPFDRESLREAVAAAAHSQPLSAAKREEAARRSDLLRRQAVDDAEAVLVRLAPHVDKIRERADWSVRWLPGYLGISVAVVGFIQESRLRTSASSDPARFPPGELLEERLRLTSDVLQAGSTILIPDLTRYGLAGECRMFAGVPVFARGKPVGVACLVDDAPGRLDAEGLTLLQAVGRRASSLLSDDRSLPAHVFWSDAGWLTRHTIELLLSLELRRGERKPVSLALVAFEAKDEAWRAPLEQIVPRRRSAIACVGPERYSVLLARDLEEESTLANELSRVTAVLADRDSVRGLGLAVYEGSVTGVSAGQLLRAADAMCAESVEGRRRSVQRIRIRHDVMCADQ